MGRVCLSMRHAGWPIVLSCRFMLTCRAEDRSADLGAPLSTDPDRALRYMCPDKPAVEARRRKGDSRQNEALRCAKIWSGLRGMRGEFETRQDSAAMVTPIADASLATRRCVPKRSAHTPCNVVKYKRTDCHVRHLMLLWVRGSRKEVGISGIGGICGSVKQNFQAWESHDRAILLRIPSLR